MTLAKTKIFLHIGHGKTGTSAVQSALAIAADKLIKSDINYPINSALQQKAARFEITSGNWAHNPNTSLTEQCMRLASSNASTCNIVLSSESLFWHLPEMIEEQEKWDQSIELHAILAVRELEEMLSSEYQQRVKRHGESKPFEQFLKRRQFVSSHHKKAAEVLTQLSHKKISFSLINYSRHKKTIGKKIFEIMNCGELYPEKEMSGLVINRSLSLKELQMLMMINALYYDQYPWISTRISDALAKELPHTETQQCRMSAKAFEKLYKTNDIYIKTINEYLGTNEALTCLNTLDRSKTSNKDPKTQQKIRQEEKLSCNLISQTLLEALRDDPAKRLSNQTVDTLIKISQSNAIPPDVKVELLEIAKANRPQGQQLAELLQQAQLKRHHG